MIEDVQAEEFSIRVQKLNGAVVIELTGEIDIPAVSHLAKALTEATKKGRGPVILDAKDLTYIYSAGIQTLLSAHRRLTETGRALAIVGSHGIFAKLMHITRLEHHFKMYPTIEDALADLCAAPA
ncbi:MAG: STAS domain-containing protein [Armatimonadetes bacterium]|nr:STAS domain-containing protein [Armatimonadota bacterium]